MRLHTAATPNGWKVSCTLEEMGLPYETVSVNLQEGEQKTSAFLALNPNGRIPVLEDDGQVVFESGAIMLYLAEKTGKLMPSDPKSRCEVMQWLMFQMAGVGPMMGQANVFYRYFPEKIQTVIARYQNESRRLFEVLNGQLQGREYLCGDFSLADIANWCWVRIHEWAGVSIEGLSPLQQWMERMSKRPACRRGVEVPQRVELPDNEAIEKMIEGGRKMLQR